MLVRFGGPFQSVTASLRVRGDKLDSAEITQMLGAEPTNAGRKGDVRPTRSRRYKYPTGIWILESDLPRTAPLEQHISKLLDRLSPDIAIWTRLSQRFSVDLFCGLFMSDANRGLELSPELLARVSERRIVLILDVYAGA